MDTSLGTLTLESLPAAAREPVLAYLARFYRNSTPAQVASRLERLPLVLSTKVPATTAATIVAELTRLGASASFAPHSVATPESASPADEPLRDTLFKRSFRSGTLRNPVSPFYRIGLAVVAVAMVTLPLIYLAIVIGVAALVGWYAVTQLQLFHTMESAKGALFLYLTPLVVGALLVFFMIKPLFARRSEEERPVQILPKAEPLLAAFIERICRIVGAPQPTVIYFDNQINASASFRRGLLSFGGNDLVLTIGLPLAAGLDLHQFAGVLAHEFGHFAQASGMRLTYVIRSVNAWFARVVYEEDAWDARLRHWSTNIDFRIAIILLVARFFIWLTRRILWLLMMLGHLISCFMLRQMEFDADRFEAGLVGAEVFASTSRRLLELSYAHHFAFEQLADAWREEKLPDNLAAFVLARDGQMSLEQRRELTGRQSTARTGLFDTHPADPERVAAARTITTPALFVWPRTAAPCASVLFKDFDTLSRRVSLDYYAKALGKTPQRHQLVDVTSMVQAWGAEDEAHAARERFFCGYFTPWRALLAGATFPTTPADPAAALARLQEVRTEIVKNLPRHGEVHAGFVALRDRVQKTGQARALLEAGFRIQPAGFFLSEAKLDAVAVNEYRHAERVKLLAQKLDPLEALQRERLNLALQLARGQSGDERNGDPAELLAGAELHWAVLSAMERQLPTLERLELAFARLNILGPQLDNRSDDEKLIAAVRAHMTELCSILTELRAALLDTPYPFHHAQAGIRLGSYLIATLPDENDLGACYASSGEALDRALQLTERLAAHLSLGAERIEQSLGLAPLGPATPEN